MFSETIGSWESAKSELSENVHDKIGASLERELFDAGRNQLDGIERQYLKAEEEKSNINALLAELRSIV